MSQLPSPDKTIALILGVSSCPRAPSLDPLPQCYASAKAFSNYLLEYQGLQDENVKDLFDSPLQPSEQIDEIEEWIVERRRFVEGVQDFIFYYCGHGGFTRGEQAYFLATSKTREGAEGATSIRYSDLAACFKRTTRGVRRFLILDCCFSAAGAALQSSLGDFVSKKAQEELPPEGTAMLCSSSKRAFSTALKDEPYTMFSGALLECLVKGIPEHQGALCIEQVGDRVRNLIQAKYLDKAIRPELHIPDQDRGSLARIPIFLNTANKAVARDIYEQIAKDAKVHGEERERLMAELRLHFSKQMPVEKILSNIYRSRDEQRPFESWIAFRPSANPISRPEFGIRKIDEKISYSLQALSGEIVGVNKYLNTAKGVIRYSYKLAGFTNNNIVFFVIPMITGERISPGHQSPPKELGTSRQDDPTNGFSIHRLRQLPEHVTDGEWRKGEIDFDFSQIDNIRSSVFAPRINEGTVNKGPGQVFITDVNVFRYE